MKVSLLQKMHLLWKEFIPLSISDVTMAFGEPMVNATMAQLPKLQTNLSALGVIKALVVLFESPIIMILHASNRLSTEKDSRLALKKFTLLFSGLLTLFLAILALPAVFFPLMQKIVGLTEEVSHQAHTMFLCLLFWPATIAVRRYFQGILIIHKQLKTIARAGLLRMFVLGICLYSGFLIKIPTSYLAAGSMMISIFAEMTAVYFVAQKFQHIEIIKNANETSMSSSPKTMKEIWKFYWPLAHSMVLVWGGRALLVVCLARAIDSSLALAVWPATWALVVLFANSTRMVQQVIIRNKNTFHPAEFILFALSVGFSLTVILLVLSFSRQGEYILTYFVGENNALMNGVKHVLMICAPIPIFVAIQNVLQGFLMCHSNTKAINRATLYGVCALLSFTALGVFQNYSGAQVAAYAMIISLGVEISFLIKKVPWKHYTYQYLHNKKIQEGIL